MPYGSPPPIDLTKPNESPYSTLSSTCSNEMNFEKKHSINSDEVKNHDFNIIFIPFIFVFFFFVSFGCI